jgi:hypothetical protein
LRVVYKVGMRSLRCYQYVGPEHVRTAAANAPGGTPIGSRDALARWISAQAKDVDGAAITATFVVTLDGALRVANRRSEHVACAAGQPVLSAGEMRFSLDGARVVSASNLSTGYCPEPASWSAVADALDRAGIAHGPRFDDEMTFRRCPRCGERNLVKDNWFVCAVCDAELPNDWNFG